MHAEMVVAYFPGITLDDDDQWRYSPDQALASLYGFHDSFYSAMWGYQLHD
jgi:hypothetical protein